MVGRIGGYLLRATVPPTGAAELELDFWNRQFPRRWMIAFHVKHSEAAMMNPTMRNRSFGRERRQHGNRN